MEETAKQVKKKFKNRIFVAKDGYGANPMLNYPRNYPCFCDSKKKFKKCCYPNLTRYIPEKDVLYYNNKLKAFLKEVEEYKKNVNPKDRRLKAIEENAKCGLVATKNNEGQGNDKKP